MRHCLYGLLLDWLVRWWVTVCSATPGLFADLPMDRHTLSLSQIGMRYRSPPKGLQRLCFHSHKFDQQGTCQS